MAKDANQRTMPASPLRPLWVRAAAAGAVMALLDVPLRTAAAPNGIVSYELAWTGARAAEMAASWQDLAASAAWASLLFDYVFMWSYGALLAGLSRRVIGGRAGGGFAIAAWTAAACDGVENAALIRMYASQPSDAAAFTAGAFASVKFALLIGVLLAVVVAALRRRAAR